MLALILLIILFWLIVGGLGLTLHGLVVLFWIAVAGLILTGLYGWTRRNMRR
jgi:hypothetical protein